MTIRGRIIRSGSSINTEDANFMLRGENATYYGSRIVQSMLDIIRIEYNEERFGIIIKDGKFIGNMAGYKGTACLIEDIPEIYILNTTFRNNSPVLWGLREHNTYYIQFIKPILDKGDDPIYFCAHDPNKFNDQEFFSLYDQDPNSMYYLIYIYIYIY